MLQGYRWMYKKVVKSDAPNDLDLLENVTLIKALERAQYEVQYLSSTSEVATLRGLLNEERKGFGVEMERLVAESDSVRHEVRPCPFSGNDDDASRR